MRASSYTIITNIALILRFSKTNDILQGIVIFVAMRNVLYFFPMNIAKVTAGSIARAKTLVTYFKDRNYKVDYVSSADFWGGPIPAEDIQQLKDERLIANHFVLTKKPPFNTFFDFLRYEIPRIIAKKLLKSGRDRISNFVTPYSKKLFNKMLQNKRYDYIIVSYAFWGTLIEDNPLIGHSKTIIDTHDFLTAQQKDNDGLQLGRSFGEEIRRLKLFDEVWTVSADEQYLFSQFCTNPVRLIPICTEAETTPSPTSKKEFDLLYVGGDNPHNIRSIKWFFDEVYHRLPTTFRICVIGTITNIIADYPNVIKVPQTKDLGYYYRKSAIAICPMLSGSGTKVKVIESLAYGLPVVCTRKGIDGLLNKVDNGCLVAETPEQFAGHIHRLHTDENFYRYQQQLAFDYHKRHHTMDVLYNTLDAMLQHP